jgi:predicted Zn finger-like uncharacterized protein
MLTRCPKCKSVHPLTAAPLAHSRGLVQCGQCGRTFSALSFLFDEWPGGEAHGPVEGANAGPPVIGASKKKPLKKDQQDAAGEDIEPAVGQPHRLAWGALFVFLLLITAGNAAWTFRAPLLQEPRIYNWLESNGWLEVEEQGLLKDPGQIQLVSRDMHTHPTRTGILVLSLTFVNLAQRPQVYPLLEITLLDATNQPIAQRRFQAKNYLRDSADIQSGLATDVFLPVLLELGDPGEQAVGFEIEFL